MTGLQNSPSAHIYAPSPPYGLTDCSIDKNGTLLCFSAILSFVTDHIQGAVSNFSKDLKSPVYALFANYYDKFRFNKSSGPECQAPIFTGFCVCHRSQWGGGGRQMEQAYTVELSRPEMILPTLLSIWQPFITGVDRFTHKSCVRIAQTRDA
jgi:hypothetical protein